MNIHPQDLLRQWLAAETAGRDRDAERALLAAFRTLPQALPSAGFADRVLRALEVPSPARGWSWRLRWAIAAGLVLAGLFTAWIPSLLAGVTQLLTPHEVLLALVRGFVALLAQGAELLEAWKVVGSLCQAVWLVLGAPPVVAAWLTLATLSALTWRGLTALLVPRRSPGYVEAR